MGKNSKRKGFVLIAHVPFKINLGLYITRRREDGYHDLETVFYPVHNLEDTIEMTQEGSDVVLVQEGGDFSIDPEKNLCVKAFRLMQSRHSLPGVRIRLQKNIPSGAGLGGGSADAAYTLKLTNGLFDLNLPDSLLEQYAAELGSDVPFFIQASPALATGKGELLSPIPLDLTHKTITVFKPDFSISTAEAYAQVRPLSGRKPLVSILHDDTKKWQSELVNDFEKTLFSKYPILAEIKQKFYNLGAEYASLSGSGSAVFAIADKPIDLTPYFNGKTVQ